jgi:hypothetical protein
VIFASVGSIDMTNDVAAKPFTGVGDIPTNLASGPQLAIRSNVPIKAQKFGTNGQL